MQSDEDTIGPWLMRSTENKEFRPLCSIHMDPSKCSAHSRAHSMLLLAAHTPCAHVCSHGCIVPQVSLLFNSHLVPRAVGDSGQPNSSSVHSINIFSTVCLFLFVLITLFPHHALHPQQQMEEDALQVFVLLGKEVIPAGMLCWLLYKGSTFAPSEGLVM